jgi:hypothetical protein
LPPERACFGWPGCPHPAPTPSDLHPTARAERIDPRDAPTIDADLSDAAWAKARVITEFKQLMPDPGGMPTERTVLRVMFDQNNLYFGIYAYDSQPDQVIVRSMSRDGEVTTGDNIQIALDPGLTRRNSYAFIIGPAGGRWDGLRLNNIEELSEWNTIWEARTRRVTDGWVAEIAIPFRSISYVEGDEGWGFEFTRSIRRKNETVRWSSLNPALPLADISEAGTLTGISDVNEGLGIDLVPYAALRAKHDWSAANEGAGISGTMGGNMFYKITPALTGTLTINPDFSDAPLDAREVNTTRFSLFLPETRAFFLQDAGNFEFGGHPFRRTNFDRVSNNGRPFFSRNLGLVKGTPVSLVAGGKLSGQYEDYNIGAVSVFTDRTPTSPGQVLSVARVTKQFGQSRAGFIFTHGDPTGLTDNTVAGGDIQYRSTLFGEKPFAADLYYERSFSSKLGNDDSYGLGLNYPNEPWGGDFIFKNIGSNFMPALGFLNRPGIRYYEADVKHLTRYRDRSAFLRTFELETRHEIYTDLHGNLDSREDRAQVQILTQGETSFAIEAQNSFDRVDVPFALPHNVVIPAGKYTWSSGFAHFRTSAALPLAAHLDAWCCDYYNGSEWRVRTELFLKLSEVYEVEADYDTSFIRLPTGRVDIQIISLSGLFNFTPDMQFAVQAQYDNDSQGFGFLGRFRWEFRPGSEILIVLGQSAVVPGTDFRFQTTQFSFRISHTLQF